KAFEEYPQAWVFVAEGEKDVDRLWAEGLIATTNVGGAGRWRDEDAELLRGRNVAVIADNDDVGREHAAKVATSLHGRAATVRVLELPVGPKGDVSDFLDAGDETPAA